MSQTRARRGLQIIAALATISVLFSLYQKMAGMSADALFYLNLTSQFALILMGVALTLYDTWPRKHPWIVLAAFAFVGAVAMLGALKQSQQSVKENTEAQKQAAATQQQLQESLNRSEEELKRLRDGMWKIEAILAQPQTNEDSLASASEILKKLLLLPFTDNGNTPSMESNSSTTRTLSFTGPDGRTIERRERVNGHSLFWSVGQGPPKGACVTGSMYTRSDGGAGSTLYACENSTWVVK